MIGAGDLTGAASAVPPLCISPDVKIAGVSCLSAGLFDSILGFARFIGFFGFGRLTTGLGVGPIRPIGAGVPPPGRVGGVGRGGVGRFGRPTGLGVEGRTGIGTGAGTITGARVGLGVGLGVGPDVGLGVGLGVGPGVGIGVGPGVSIGVGAGVRLGDGSGVNTAVGVADGTGEGISKMTDIDVSEPRKRLKISKSKVFLSFAVSSSRISEFIPLLSSLDDFSLFCNKRWRPFQTSCAVVFSRRIVKTLTSKNNNCILYLGFDMQIECRLLKAKKSERLEKWFECARWTKMWGTQLAM